MDNTRNQKDIIQELARQLVYFPINDFLKLSKPGVKLSRNYHVQVLKHVLNDEITDLRLNAIVNEPCPQNDFYHRLDFFEYFTEKMLVDLALKVGRVKPDFKSWYLENFWILIVQVGHQLGLSENTFDKMLEKSKEDKEITLTLEEILESTKTLFADPVGYIDGVTKDVFKTLTYEGATIGELKDYASENKITLPKSVSKGDIITWIIEKTPVDDVNDDFLNKLNNYNIQELKDHVRDHKLNVLTDLGKHEIAAYVANLYTRSVEFIAKPIEFQLYAKELDIDLLQTHPKFIELTKELSSKDREIFKLKAQLEKPVEVVVEEIQPEKKKRNTYKILFYILLSLIIVGMVFVSFFILDKVGVLPHESNGVTEFFYNVTRYVYDLFVKFLKLFKS